MARITSPTSRSGGFLSLLFWFVVSLSIIHRESSSRLVEGRTHDFKPLLVLVQVFYKAAEAVLQEKAHRQAREALGARPRI